MKYIFEKNHKIPLCGVRDDYYYKFEDGSVITSSNVLEFINNGLNKKTLIIKETNLEIYEIFGKHKLVAYKYIINGKPYYLDSFKMPLTKKECDFVSNKISRQLYKEVLLWGIDDE